MQKTKDILFSLLPLLLLTGVPVLVLPYCAKFIIEDFYFFAISVLFFGIAGIALLKLPRFSIKLTRTDILATVYFAYFILNNILFSEAFQTIKFISVLLQGGVYILVRRTNTQSTSLSNFSNWMLSIAGFEIIAGFLQYFNIIQNLQSNMPFGGSFANPGPFAIFLACLITLTLHSILNHNNSRFILVIKYTLMALAIYLIVVSKIRSAWIALAVGVISIVAYNYSLHKRIIKAPIGITILSTITLAIGIGIVGYFLFNMKKDSALGRLFIWDNSVEVIKNRPLLGVGTNNFEYFYNEQQAKTIASGQLNELELLQAGDVVYAFNDYLHITIENGIIGLVLFSLLIIFSIQSAIKYKGEKKKDLVGASAIIFAMLVGSLTSYPLSILKNSLLFTIAIAFISSSSIVIFNFNLQSKSTPFAVLKSGFMLTLTVALAFIMSHILYHYKWYKLTSEYDKNNISSFNKEIENVYQHIYYNNDFLYNYASILSVTGNNEKAYLLIKEIDSRKLFNSYNYALLKGDLLLKMGNFVEAKDAYKQALNIIPSRLIPRYSLLTCHHYLREELQAISMAEEILSTPVKIYNSTSEIIQQKAKIYIIQIEHNSKIN